MSNKGKGQTFMFGAVILMISNITVKLIGALFKIPLQNYILGDEGMAYFQAAYDIYVSFYMISTAGIPVAISRMIAASNSGEMTGRFRKSSGYPIGCFLSSVL